MSKQSKTVKPIARRKFGQLPPTVLLRRANRIPCSTFLLSVLLAIRRELEDRSVRRSALGFLLISGLSSGLAATLREMGHSGLCS